MRRKNLFLFYLIKISLISNLVVIKAPKKAKSQHQTQQDIIFDQTLLKVKVTLNLQQEIFAQALIDAIDELFQTLPEDRMYEIGGILQTYLDNKLPFNSTPTKKHWHYNAAENVFIFDKRFNTPFIVDKNLEKLLHKNYLVSSNGIYSPQL